MSNCLPQPYKHWTLLQDILQKEGKAAGPVGWSGQCSTENPWVLVVILQGQYRPFIATMFPSHCKDFRNGLRNMKNWRYRPYFNLTEDLWDVLYTLVQSKKAMMPLHYDSNLALILYIVFRQTGLQIFYYFIGLIQIPWSMLCKLLILKPKLSFASSSDYTTRGIKERLKAFLHAVRSRIYIRCRSCLFWSCREHWSVYSLFLLGVRMCMRRGESALGYASAD